uniref:Uncharacterized protein n=1 Tax=Onchocerca volvulus TaxID=6282 RepID=A0A8R1XLJ4_ONCVO
MSSSIVASIQPAKTRLVLLLNEITTLVFESPDPDKIDRVQLCVKSLKEAYDTWLAYIQTITTTKKRDEEEKIFESVLEGEQGLFRIVHEGQEAIITLTRHKNESEQKLEK